MGNWNSQPSIHQESWMLLEELVHPGFISSRIDQVLKNLDIVPQPLTVSFYRDPTRVASAVSRGVIVFTFNVGVFSSQCRTDLSTTVFKPKHHANVAIVLKHAILILNDDGLNLPQCQISLMLNDQMCVGVYFLSGGQLVVWCIVQNHERDGPPFTSVSHRTTLRQRTNVLREFQ